MSMAKVMRRNQRVGRGGAAGGTVHLDGDATSITEWRGRIPGKRGLGFVSCIVMIASDGVVRCVGRLNSHCSIPRAAQRKLVGVIVEISEMSPADLRRAAPGDSYLVARLPLHAATIG